MMCDFRQSHFFRLLLLLLVGSLSSAAFIENNGYKDIVVSFSSSISQKDVDLAKLKAIFQEASQYLFHSTRRRSYFSDILVVVPSSWDESFCTPGDSSDMFQNHDISVYIQDHSPPRAQHSKSCGEKGEMIFIPSVWFKRDRNDDDIKDLARQLVQQWAIYRYGVFEEKPLSEGSCFAMSTETWSPTGCYNLQINAGLSLDSKGLPVCHFDDDISAHWGIKSSIMFDTSSANITDFCDGSVSLPHSPVTQTRHNILCDRRPVWGVIKNSEDFKYGVNPPVQNAKFNPKLAVRCYHEKKPNLLFVVQNASTTDITKIVVEVRLSLSRFLLFSASSDTKVAITTFSGELETASSDTAVLNLMKKEETIATLKKNIRVMGPVKEVCIPCGLKKSATVLSAEGNNDAVVALITLASAVEKTKPHEFLSALENVTQTLYLLVIDDVKEFVIPSAFVRGIYGKGGRIFYLPFNPVHLNIELNAALANALRKPFHLEEDLIIVHHTTFSSVVSDIIDEFTLDARMQGQLVYTIKCDNADMLDFKNSGCTDLEYLKEGGYQCGMVEDLKSTNESHRFWKFEFLYLGGYQHLACSSLATLRLWDNQEQPITLRGWLSHYEVRPGQNALVIYAEVLNNFKSVANVRVEAHIYRPRSNSSPAFVLELRDNGNGDPDVKKDDGIYTRYFSFFTSKGVYSVLIKAFGEATTGDDQNLLTVSRVVSIGSFVVVEHPPQMDVYPPNKIADLRVVEVDHESSTVTLHWTAPGDDYDYGQALSYDVKMSESWAGLTDVAFDTVPINLKSTNEEETPSVSGNTEKRRFQFRSPNADAIYFIAIRAHDNYEGALAVSNIVQIYLKAKQVETSPYPTQSTGQHKSTSELTVTDIYTDDGNVTNATSEFTSDDYFTESTNSSGIPEITTVGPTNNTSDACSDSQLIIILASSIGSGCLLLIILINILVCVCCCSEKRKPRKLTKRESMLPPYNMNITYKQKAVNTKSASSVESIDELVQTDEYAAPNSQYSYVNNSNLRPSALNTDTVRHQRFNDYEDYRNGFQLATAVPAYATSTFASQSSNESGRTSPKNQPPLGTPMIVGDAQIYHLGSV